jgi:transposase
MRPQGSARELEQRRLIAGRMFQDGKSTTEIARLLGVTKPAVSNWRKLWKARGAAGLAAKPAGHRRCLLSPAQKQQLAGLIDQGPAAHGLPKPFWTLPLVGQLVRERFDVTYGPTQLWRLMHELGFSCQRPKRVARQRDETAIDAWRRRTWPRLKKGPPRGPLDPLRRRGGRLAAAAGAAHLGPPRRHAGGAALAPR